MWHEILNSLTPVFLVILLGTALRTSGFLSPEFFQGMNKLVFWVGLPTLLFYKIATASLAGGAALRIFVVILASSLAVILTSLIVAHLLRVPAGARGAFGQAAFRGNLAYVGLPVIAYALTDATLGEAMPVETVAVLVLAPTVPLYNVASVLLLSMFQADGERVKLSRVLLRVAGNPLLIACALGSAVSLSGTTMPGIVDRTLAAVAQMALPLALISIGASLTRERVKGSIRLALLAALLKTALTPLVGFGFARWMGLEPMEMRVALLYLACPTAIASYVMAEQLGSDDALAGSAVVLSTLLSVFSLAAVLALTG